MLMRIDFLPGFGLPHPPPLLAAIILLVWVYARRGQLTRPLEEPPGTGPSSCGRNWSGWRNMIS